MIPRRRHLRGRRCRFVSLLRRRYPFCQPSRPPSRLRSHQAFLRLFSYSNFSLLTRHTQKRQLSHLFLRFHFCFFLILCFSFIQLLKSIKNQYKSVKVFGNMNLISLSLELIKNNLVNFFTNIINIMYYFTCLKNWSIFAEYQNKVFYWHLC